MVVKIELEVRMAVKIVRVLNTNAVVSSDQEGRELIITGAGIGFKKKKGENLDEALADKIYGSQVSSYFLMLYSHDICQLRN